MNTRHLKSTWKDIQLDLGGEKVRESFLEEMIALQSPEDGIRVIKQMVEKRLKTMYAESSFCKGSEPSECE